MAPRSEPRSPATTTRTPESSQAGQPLRRSARLNPRVCAVGSRPQPAGPQLLRYEQCLGPREGPHSFCSLVLEDLHTGHKEYLGDIQQLVAALPRSLDPGSHLTLTAQVAPPGQKCLPRAMRATLWWLLPSDGEFQSAPDGQHYYLACQGRRVVLRGGDVKAPLVNSHVNWIHDPHPKQPPRVTPRQAVNKKNNNTVPRRNRNTVPKNNNVLQNKQSHAQSSHETLPNASSPRRNVPTHSQAMPKSNMQKNNKNEANNSPQTPKRKRDRRHRRERRARERENRNESFIHDARWANQRSLVPASSSVPVRVTQSVPQAVDPISSMRTAVYPPLESVGNPTANENSPFQIGLESSRDLGL